MRRLHGAGQRPSGAVLHDAGTACRRRRGDHGRRSRARRRADRRATGIPGERRVPVWFLHSGTGDFGDRLYRRGTHRIRRRDPGMDEREHLPVRGLPANRRGGHEGGNLMRTFEFERIAGIDEALAALREPGSQAIAGGTELVNWLKEGIESPSRLVDINGLPLAGFDLDEDALTIGALVRMSDLASDSAVSQRFPVLVESLLGAASPQLRNMASIGGNLMQRTRCP